MQPQPILVAGEWRQGASPLTVHSPFDGSIAGATFLAAPGQLEEAIAAAAASFDATRRLTAEARRRILAAVSSGIARQKEEFARTIAREAAKPITAARAEVDRAVFTFALAAEAAAAADREQPLDIPMPQGVPRRHGRLRRFPVGPIAAITPFNFPLNLVAHKLAPAIAAGCPIVLKPAPQTPLSSLALARLILDAGWPPAALSVVPLRNEDAGPLVADDRLKLLSFTGSSAVGWQLKAKAGKKRVVLELGGNAAVKFTSVSTSIN